MNLPEPTIFFKKLYSKFNFVFDKYNIQTGEECKVASGKYDENVKNQLVQPGSDNPEEDKAGIFTGYLATPSSLNMGCRALW